MYVFMYMRKHNNVRKAIANYKKKTVKYLIKQTEIYVCTY